MATESLSTTCSARRISPGDVAIPAGAAEMQVSKGLLVEEEDGVGSSWLVAEASAAGAFSAAATSPSIATDARRISPGDVAVTVVAAQVPKGFSVEEEEDGVGSSWLVAEAYAAGDFSAAATSPSIATESGKVGRDAHTG
ncbi:hypothetical protein BHE74_00002588 [Ensete ventricosum]|nr:hypothetical protein BHE74_00002588 [Ensete ventricosum]